MRKQYTREEIGVKIYQATKDAVDGIDQDVLDGLSGKLFVAIELYNGVSVVQYIDTPAQETTINVLLDGVVMYKLTFSDVVKELVPPAISVSCDVAFNLINRLN